MVCSYSYELVLKTRGGYYRDIRISCNLSFVERKQPANNSLEKGTIEHCVLKHSKEKSISYNWFDMRSVILVAYNFIIVRAHY